MDSEGVGKIKAISSKFRWQINDFRRCCQNVGDFLISPKFMASTAPSDVRWYLMLYPKGNTQSNKDYLSLFLFSTEQVKAACNFKILNKRSEAVLNITTNEYAFGHITWGYGYEKLLSTDFIEDPVNSILSNGNLTILCEILYMPRYIVKEMKSSKEVENHEANVLSRLKVLDIYEDLLNDKKFSDVSLIAEDKTVKVHKCILAKNSSVFAAMFDAEMKEKHENIVRVADIKYDVLVEMIRFVYTGKVNKYDTLVDELAVAADKYVLDGLKDMCERKMREKLSVDNVVDYLKFADRLRMNKLKEKAIELIVENASDVTDKPEFQTLPCDIVCKVCSTLAKKCKLASAV